jgi:hypothetical protein
MIAILTSLITPVFSLTASDAAAQGEPPNCDLGYVVSDDGTECVPADQNDQNDQQEQQQEPQQQDETCPEGQVFDPNSNGCVPEVNQPQDNSYLQIDKFDCPVGTDWTQATYQDLTAGCAPSTTPVTMEITPPGGQAQQQSFTGTLQLGPFAAGQFAITEMVNPGYWTPWVACDGFLANETPQPTTAAMNTAVTWPVAQDESLYCQFFNIPIGGAVTVYKWQCADQTEFGRELDYYQGSLPEQQTGPCETEHLNIPITLTDAAGPHATTTQANGTQWSPVLPDANGHFQIAVDEPDGFGDPMVFCGTLDDQTQTAVPATGAQVTLTAPLNTPSFGIQCNWYDIPAQPNSITIYKWQCEPGTEPGRELEYYQGGLPDQPTGPCETEHLNIPISLIDGAPDSPHETTTQANGTQFDDVVLDQNGGFKVTITEPDGFGDPMVFCATLDQDTQTAVTATGGTITITPTGQPFTYQCNWYDIPSTTTTTGTTGQIVIEKYWCPQGLSFVQTPTRADMQAACQEQPGTGANFTLTGPAAAPQTWPDMQPSGPSPQSFTWPDLPAGDYTIAENGLGGGWMSTVYCHASSGQPNGEAEEMLSGPSVTRTLQAGYTIDCAWFNQPTETTQTTENSITVYKWQCESGTESGRELEYYQGGLPDQQTGPCETEHLNIPISLIHGGPQQDTTTQANGTQFDNVVLDQNGSFQIAITEPAGYGEPMVFCASIDTDTQAPVTATNGAFTITPGSEPFTWQCNVYDIPTTGYQLDLYKYTCASTVDRNLGLPDLGSNPGCMPLQGASFTASFGTTPGSARYTDPNGQLSWPGVEGGPWTLTEGQTTGYDAPKVFCGPPQSAETPEVTVTNLSVSGTLDASTPHIICYWFNFEQPTTNGRITVYKYQCPPGTTSTDFGVLQESCTSPHNGIDFTLAGNGVSQSASTDARADARI